MRLVHGSDSTQLFNLIINSTNCYITFICTSLSSQSSQHHVKGSTSVLLTVQTAFLSTWRGYATLHPSQAWHGFWAWLTLVSVINLPPSNCFHKSHIQFPYNYHMKSKSFQTCLTSWVHDTLHTYIYKFKLLFLFFLPVARQVSWHQLLMQGTRTL